MFGIGKNMKDKNDLSSISKQYNEYFDKENKDCVKGEQDDEFEKRTLLVDEYFLEAANLVVEMKTAWIGSLQKEFEIGVNRANRIIEQLCEEGIVGKSIGERKPRNVLMTKEQLEEYLSNVEIVPHKYKGTVIHKKTIGKEQKVDMYNNKYDYMTGEDFEVFVAQIIRKIGFSNIQFTKGSGDQGVDIIAERDGIKHAIQCKRYSQAVGNRAVQEVFAGKSFYHCHIGVVVTNNYFTQSAKDLAKENGVVLWDRSFLDKYVNANGVPQIVGINDNCNTIEIYDVEQEIVAIKDEVISKALFEYMDAVSRTAIDMYIAKGNENEYSQEMLNCIKEPILFYNAKFILALGSLKFIYYCKMGECFKNTKTYAYLKELSEKSSGKFEDDLFQIDVFYEIDDIVLIDKDVEIKQFPEISILPGNMDTMKCLEDLDKYNLQSNDECYITENYFVMKMENIKISS